MHMPTDETEGEGFHCVHQKVTAYGLDYVLDELWTVALDPLPLLRGSDSFVGDRFPTESVLSDAGLDVAEPSL